LSYIHGYIAALPQFNGCDPQVAIEASGNVDLSQITSLPSSDSLMVSGNGTITISDGLGPHTYFAGQVQTNAGVTIKDSSNTHSWSAQEAGAFTPVATSHSSGGNQAAATSPANNQGCSDNTPVGYPDLFQIKRRGSICFPSPPGQRLRRRSTLKLVN
jgi:hypothetical protein